MPKATLCMLGLLSLSPLFSIGAEQGRMEVLQEAKETGGDSQSTVVIDTRKLLSGAGVGQGKPLKSLVFSPTGDHVAFVGADNIVCVLDADSGKVIHRIAPGAKVRIDELAFSYDGRMLIGTEWFHEDTEKCRFHFWEVARGKPRSFLPTAVGGKGIAVRGDWTVIAAVVSREVNWKRQYPDSLLLVRPPPPAAVPSEIRIWEYPTGKLISRLAMIARPREPLAFSPVGTGLASGGEKVEVSKPTKVKIIDNYTPKPITIYTPKLCIWNSVNGTLVREFPVSDWVVALRYSPDGKTLVSGCSNGQVHVWDVATGKEKLTFKHDKPMAGGNVVAVSPDASLVATSDYSSKRITLWDATSGKQLGYFAGDPGNVTCLAFSPDSERLALGNVDSTVLIWDVNAVQPLKLGGKH